MSTKLPIHVFSVLLKKFCFSTELNSFVLSVFFFIFCSRLELVIDPRSLEGDNYNLYMCVLSITQLLRLLGRFGFRKPV